MCGFQITAAVAVFGHICMRFSVIHVGDAVSRNNSACGFRLSMFDMRFLEIIVHIGGGINSIININSRMNILKTS